MSRPFLVIHKQPCLTSDQLDTIIDVFKDMYPNSYGYIDDRDATIKTFLLFRSKEESFNNNPTRAVVTIKYKDEVK